MPLQSRSGKLVLAALMCALLVVTALVVVPAGPVPFTLAVFGVALLGAVLPPSWAAASLSAYLLLGLCGLPVFAGFAAGPGVLFGPTGGYLAGYYLLALGVSFTRGRPLPVQGLGAFLGMAGCYLLGTLWYSAVTGAPFVSGLLLCVAPFVLPDAAKITLALLLARALQRRLAPRAS